MLSFEEDFQDVYILAPLTQKSQSGAEFFSYFISIQFEAGLYLLAVATVTHIFLFNLFPFRIYKRFFPYMAIMLKQIKESNIVHWQD